MKLRTFGLFIIPWMLLSGAGVNAVIAQNRPDLDALLTQLRVRTGSASSDAKVALLARANADPQAKAYITDHLPAVLESYGGGKDKSENYAWGEAAQIAGELKIEAAVPILCRRIQLITYPMSGISFDHNYINRSAAQALIQIGAPAVPAIKEILGHSEPARREEAVYVLGRIDTATAREALQDQLLKEKDTKVRQRIEEVLRPRR